jgi:hypothetical protein
MKFDMLCNRVIHKIVSTLIHIGESIMATLTEVQANVIALQAAQVAEQARQDAKNLALQNTITGVNATLATVQAELDALKAGGQTPENQVIIDDVNAKVLAVTVALNAAAV